MNMTFDETCQKAVDQVLANRTITRADIPNIQRWTLDVLYPMIDAHNAVVPNQSDEKWKKPLRMTPYQIAYILLKICCIKNVCTGDETDNMLCMYQYEGPKKGLYVMHSYDGRGPIENAIRMISKVSIQDVKEIIREMMSFAETVHVNTDRDLIPVNNGIFNYKTKELMPFSPEYVFLAKISTDYVPGAQNPVIHNQDDGTDWDVESWMKSLSDDPEVVNLLWQLTGAVIRPGVRWNKLVMMYAQSGNNGKGTLCHLMTELCGKGNVQALCLADFGKQYLPGKLISSVAVIAHENTVEKYIKESSNLKALVTGDPIQLESKYKDSIQAFFRGIIIQCVNRFPEFEDKTGSLTRRLLIIPMTKCFTGIERRYIKDDYLCRKEVLQYVLYKVLNMPSYYCLDEPGSCRRILEMFQSANDPVRQFLGEILPCLQWDIVPNQFFFDLYVAWYNKNVPSGKVKGKQRFLDDVREIFIQDELNAMMGGQKVYPWKFTDGTKRIGSMMDKPEPLIKEYGLTDWMNMSYAGSDPEKLCCIPDAKKKDTTKGIIRL